jgi:hypothetical protein
MTRVGSNFTLELIPTPKTDPCLKTVKTKKNKIENPPTKKDKIFSSFSTEKQK